MSNDTALFNQNRKLAFSNRTVQRNLYKQGYLRRIVHKRIPEVNLKSRLSGCRGNRHKTVDNYWNRVISTDECKIDISSNSRISIWWKVGEDEMQFSLMIWGCFTYYGVGTITVVDGNINAQKNIDIIDEHL